MYDFQRDFQREYEKQLAAIESQQQLCKELEYLQNSNKQDEGLREMIFHNKRHLYILAKQKEFLRPDSQEDTDYRIDVHMNFFRKAKEELPDDVPLRFHGTSIYFAREIIESGEISCSQDRLGYQTSYDLSGHISVVTKDNIDTAINGYVDLLNFCLPAGCLFALLPSKEDGVVYGDQMKKVDFKSSPDILYSIITTPENVSRVKEWCRKSGVASDKVCDFYEFLEKFKKHEKASCIVMHHTAS